MKHLPIVLLAASGPAFGQCEVVPGTATWVSITPITTVSRIPSSTTHGVLTGSYRPTTYGNGSHYVVSPGSGKPINIPQRYNDAGVILRIARNTTNDNGMMPMLPIGYTFDTNGNLTGSASMSHPTYGNSYTSGGRYNHPYGPYHPAAPLIMPGEWCDRWGNPSANGPITIQSSGQVEMFVNGLTYVRGVNINAETAASVVRPLALTASPNRMDFGTVAYPGTNQRELTTSVTGSSGTRYALTYSYVADSGPEHRITVQGQTLPWTVSNQIQAGQSQDTQKVVVGAFSANSGAVSGRLLITATLV